jgi:hypothetical protein
MEKKKPRRSPKTMWAYAYEIVPPQPEDRLRAVKALLDHAHSEAQGRARAWAARLVLEPLVTHILVVTDSPEQNREVNRKLEAELLQLQAGFSVTTPLAVEEDATPSAPERRKRGAA